MFPAVFTTLIGIQVWSGGSVSVIKPSSCEPIWQDTARDRFWAFNLNYFNLKALFNLSFYLFAV